MSMGSEHRTGATTRVAVQLMMMVPLFFHTVIKKYHHLIVILLLFMLFLLYYFLPQRSPHPLPQMLNPNFKLDPKLKVVDPFDSFDAATCTEVVNCSDVQGTIVHLAFLAAGSETSKSVVTVLKSILCYRRSSLHLHLVVDKPAQLILQTVLQTWLLPLLNYSFYFTDTMEWQGVSVGLTLSTILPLTVQSVIILDANITVLTDITRLWSYLPLMHRERKLIGMVENQRRLETGFNTGVILMDLKSMRENDAQWNLMEHTSLNGDNAIIKDHLSHVYTLPCNWNIQLSRSASTNCYPQSNRHDIIIHWNKRAARSHNIYDKFVQYDGKSLRKGLLHCATKMESLQRSAHAPNTLCTPFEQHSSIIYRTHLYYYGQQYTATSDNDVTLVTQFSFNRLPIIRSIAEHWEGPISLAAYVSADSEALELEKQIGALQRSNIAVHLVYKYGMFYPVNHMRNIALRNIGTPYFFLIDVDFIPMFGLYEHLKMSVATLQPANHKQALVVPAFEAVHEDFVYPKSKESLLQMIHKGTIRIVKITFWTKGHEPTNYKKWYKVSEPYDAVWTNMYEPFMVLQKNVSQYDERLVGELGWDKIGYTILLHAQGYKFTVLPNAFIIHSPHPPMPGLVNRSRYSTCLNEFRGRYKTELIQKYGKTPF